MKMPIFSGHFSVFASIVRKNGNYYTQWRRRDFFGGEMPLPLKGYQAPNAGCPGGEGPPPDGSKFTFLKQLKVFENEFIFFPKNPFFYKNLEKLNIFCKNF